MIVDWESGVGGSRLYTKMVDSSVSELDGVLIGTTTDCAELLDDDDDEQDEDEESLPEPQFTMTLLRFWLLLKFRIRPFGPCARPCLSLICRGGKVRIGRIVD